MQRTRPGDSHRALDGCEKQTLQRGQTRYTHDPFGRLTRVREDDDGNGADEIDIEYGYTPDSRLAWRYDHIAGERVEFVYWGGRIVQEIREDAGDSHTVLWEHVWLGSRLVRSHEAPTGKSYHLHHDRLGSVVMATSGDGTTATVEGRNTYDPYGKAVSLPTWSGDPVPVPYGFTGQRQDGATGLYLMHHRWYDPETGRFVEQDPIGESGGLNVYAYVGSSPTMWVDPTGLQQSSANGPNSWQNWVGLFMPQSERGDGAREAANFFRESRDSHAREFLARSEARMEKAFAKAAAKKRDANEKKEEGEGDDPGSQKTANATRHGAAGLEVVGSENERKAVLRNIQAGLRPEDRGHVRMVEGSDDQGNPSGRYFIEVDNDHRSNDGNFRDLQKLTNTPGHVVVQLYTQGDGPVIGEKLDGSSTFDYGPALGKGMQGLTLPSKAMVANSGLDKTGYFSQDSGTVHVYIATWQSARQQVVTTAHELYGHALAGILGRPAVHGIPEVDRQIAAIEKRTLLNLQSGGMP